MIKSNHKLWANFVFKKYIKKQFKQNFHSFKLIGDLPKIKQSPTLLIANHSSWWDGFFIYYWNVRLLKKKYHVMMLEHQLKRYYFFQYLGAYSIKQDSPKGIIESLNYTSNLLKLDNNLVNIFPEGEMNYSFKNEVDYKKGLLKIIDKCDNDVQIIHLGMKIHHLFEEKPEVFFTFREVSKESLSKENLELEMKQMLENIDNNLENGKVIYEGKKSK